MCSAFRIQCLVYDEADRLMTNETLQDDLGMDPVNMWHKQQLDVILGALPEDRQNLLFSATMLSEPCGTIASQLHDPIFRYEVCIFEYLSF